LGVANFDPNFEIYEIGVSNLIPHFCLEVANFDPNFESLLSSELVLRFLRHTVWRFQWGSRMQFQSDKHAQICCKDQNQIKKAQRNKKHDRSYDCWGNFFFIPFRIGSIISTFISMWIKLENGTGARLLNTGSECRGTTRTATFSVPFPTYTFSFGVLGVRPWSVCERKRENKRILLKTPVFNPQMKKTAYWRFRYWVVHKSV
jgi:hypothetical protein